MLKLVEENAGVGHLESGSTIVSDVPYRVSRYQGMAASGLPIPGLFRVEGTIDPNAVEGFPAWIGSDLTLRLEDGRALRVTLVDDGGRLLAEGHGPGRCGCC